jgi:hypothetical protein
MRTSWAIILCKFKDNSSEPFARNFYDRLFTTSGTGTNNMVNFFDENSHGKLDLTGSRVFGWYTINKNRSEYTGSGPNFAGRLQLVNWGKQAAIDAGVDLTPYFGVVVVLNVPTDLFGGGGRMAVCDNLSMMPSLLGQEMGHGYGLSHSKRQGSADDYQDPWDVMSTANAYMQADSNYSLIGPSLNAWNMRGRGWLEESRVWKGNGASPITIELLPITRRDLPGYLAAELPGGYLVEFRVKEKWDGAIPRPCVLVHRFEGNQSYLMPGRAGNFDLVAGDTFEIGTPGVPSSNYARVQVVSINATARKATVGITYNSSHWCGVQFNATLPAGATQTWFTHSWPQEWQVVWSVVPTAPIIDGNAQLEFKVQVDRQATGLLKYFIQITNLLAQPVTAEARFCVLAS